MGQSKAFNGWSRSARESQFNPDMLRIARGAKPFTQVQLSKEIGVTQSAISKWEDGLAVPSDGDIQKLSLALNFPVDFFFQSSRLYGFGACFHHRKRASLGAKALATIHDRINVLRLGTMRLLRQIEDFQVKFESLALHDFKSPEAVARELRAMWQMPLGPIRNLTAVVESAGGVILACNFETGRLDAISQWPPGCPPLFFVNRKCPIDRLRFTIAHEIGHVVMHTGIASSDGEAEADRFAAEFLMPARDIRSDLSGLTLEKALRLKYQWRVSMQAIIRRARDLDVIDESRYRSLNVLLSKKGYRTSEPGELAPEPPTTLNRICEAQRTHLGYSPGDIAEIAFCPDEATFRSRFLGQPHSPGLKVFPAERMQ